MTRADLLEQWRTYLAATRRRSPHTVRAYVATAARLLDRCQFDDWGSLARLDATDLRTQLAARRAEGLGNVSAARELSALVATRIVERGETPYLHAYASNAPAIQLYESLGFKLRCAMHVAVIARA